MEHAPVAPVDLAGVVQHWPLLPWQQRVVDEREELQGRISRLMGFIGGPAFTLASHEEQCLLKAQIQVMIAYSEILTQRIRSWGREL
jgi:hypothetical protein